MSRIMLNAYVKRWINELSTLKSFHEFKNLAVRTSRALICEWWVALVKNNRFDDKLSHTRVLYVDSTGSDGYGIGDGIFTLPMLHTLWSISCLDVLTTSVRKVIFDNQFHINNVFTALDQPWNDYHYILLLHRSVRKFQFVLDKYWVTWLKSRLLLSTYVDRFYRDIHCNQVELVYLGVKDIVSALPPLTSFTPQYSTEWRNQRIWFKFCTEVLIRKKYKYCCR